MRVLVGNKYIVREELHLQDLSKALMYASVAIHYDVFTDCRVRAEYENGKYYFIMEQEVPENASVYNLLELEGKLNDYLYEKLTPRKKEIYTGPKIRTFRNISDVNKLLGELNKNKLITYDSLARVSRKIARVIAFDVLVGQSDRKPEDFTLFTTDDQRYKLLNTSNNQGLLSFHPGLTFFMPNEKYTSNIPQNYKELFKARRGLKNNSSFSPDFVDQVTELFEKMSLDNFDQAIQSLDNIDYHSRRFVDSTMKRAARTRFEDHRRLVSDSFSTITM